MQWLTFSALGYSITLGWDASPDTNVVGYKVYYGSASHNYTNILTLGNITSATVSGLVEGVTYYFAVTAYTGAGLESDFSNEISYTVPNPNVNQPPTLNAINNVGINEDAGQQTVNLSGITDGATNENQTLTVIASSSNTGLIPNPTVSYISPNTTGTITFTPTANASGSATITVTVDDGQAQNNTITRSFIVTVNAVNDLPTLNVIGNLTINEDGGQQTVNLSGITSGAGNENQVLTVTASSSNTGLIPNPTVNYNSPNTTGALTFTPVPNANGSATVTVTVSDGQAQASRTFTVTVSAANDTPTLNAIGNLNISENTGQQTVNLSGISSGATNESQTLVVTASSSNTGLIPNPTVSYTSPNATGTLTFTPVIDANGSATITVTVSDGQAQTTRTFTVAVNPVNGAPTLDAISDITISEDAGQQTVNLSGITSGATNESQTLTVTATSGNTGLIPNPTVGYNSPNTTGTLIFTPVPNVNGSATITVTVSDGQAQTSRTFTVTASAVNDTPTLNAIGNLNISENAGLQTVNLSGISSGATNENQTLTVTTSSSDTSLIPTPTVAYTSPNATGTLTFTPVLNGNGSATITVTVSDGQAQVSRTFTVTINPVNSPPTLDAISAITITEDGGQQTVNLSGITSGAGNENQALTVTASSGNTGLIPNPTVTYSSPNTTGTLTFTPVPNANGSATVTVTVSDGQAQTSRTFTVTVNAVNDTPTLNAIGNLNIAENAGQQTVNLSGISSGATNESQTLVVTASSSNTGLIPNPTVSYTSPNATGTLAFTPVVDANGSATITVTVSDGQTQVSRTFTVTVNSVNSPPTLNAISNLTISEDATQQTVNLSGITSGATNEDQTLTVTATSSNTGLIPNPTVNYNSPNTTGTLALTPAANGNGSVTVTVTVSDGQAQTSRTFTVTVNAVNDPPTLNALGGLSLNQNAGQQTVNLSGISTGATNENQSLTVTASSSNTGLIPNPTVSYTSPNATGTLTFTPVANANGSATVTVTVSDGQAQTNRTFIVTVNGTPTISTITDKTISINTNTGPVAFTVNDSETPAGSLTVSALSSNPGLIPVNSIVFGGSGGNRTVTLTPVIGQTGTSTITIAVSDGSASASTVFQLTVLSGPPPPPTNLIILETNGDGIITPNLEGQALTSGKTYSITAVPAEGQIFTGWTGSTNYAAHKLTFTMRSNLYLNVTANFMPLHIETNGIGAISPNLLKMTNVVLGKVYRLTAGSGIGQMFTGWTGDTNTLSPTIDVVASTNLSLMANFVPVNLTMDTNSTLSPNPLTTANLVAGRTYTVTASGGMGQMFVGWTGTTNTKSSKISFVMNTNVLLKANSVPFNLTVTGDGKISPDLKKTANLIIGKFYMLTAVPGKDQVFAGWSGTANTLLPKIGFVMATNVALHATFIPSPYIPIAGTYNGLFYENSEVRQGSSGFLSVSVNTRGNYSGQLQLGGSRHSFAGNLPLDCHATNIISRKYTNALYLVLNFGVGGQTNKVTGQLMDGYWLADVSGDRAVFDGRANLAPYASNYTMIVPRGSAIPATEMGDGYGSLSVNTKGQIKFSGMLADGTKITQGTGVSKDGYWPVYIPLYSGKGSVLSWLTFTNRPSDDLNGLMSWIKQAGVKGAYYTNGFSNECDVAGSTFVKPAKTNLVLNLPNANVSFEGGNLASNFVNVVLIGPGNKVTNLSSNKLALSFSTSGTFGGSVTDPASGKSLKFNGAVLQKQNAGFGYMLSTNQSSRVVVSP